MVHWHYKIPRVLIIKEFENNFNLKYNFSYELYKRLQYNFVK